MNANRIVFDIHKDRTALIVIDMQNAFVAPGGGRENVRGREMVPRLNTLIQACRQADIPVVFTLQQHRADGSDMGLTAHFIPEVAARSTLIEGTSEVELFPQIDHCDSDIKIVKRSHSALCGTELDLILRGKGIDTLIICGVDTVACCEATARDARHLNYKVIFLSDGTATRDRPDMGWGAFTADVAQRFTLTLLAMRYAEVASVDDIMQRVKRLGAG